MSYPEVRPRRLRRTAALRRLVEETRVAPAELILERIARCREAGFVAHGCALVSAFTMAASPSGARFEPSAATHSRVPST